MASLQFAGMVAGGVQNAEDDDGVAFDSKKNFVRKPIHHQATKSAVVKGKLSGRALQSNHVIGDMGEKLIAQAGPSRFVPVSGLMNVGTSRGPDGDVPVHRCLLAQMSRSVCRQGVPALPSRSNSAKA